MHFHVRMDKPDFIGEGKTLGIEEKDFRSLRAFLNWVQSAYGKWALCWQIDGIDGSENNARKLLPALERSIDDSFQWVYMGVNKSSPDYRKCDAYCFTVSKRDGDPEKGFSFTENEEAIMLSEDVFAPDVNRSIKDILGSFEIIEDSDFAGRAFKALVALYGGENKIPSAVRKQKGKGPLQPEDYIALADECQNCDEEQLAAPLYAAGYYARGEAENRGEALVKLAELYMTSEWPKTGGREYDVMKAVDLLTEAVALGRTEDAKNALIDLREQTISEYEDEPDLEECEDGPDVDFFINNLPGDALCLIGFCFGVGVGCEKDLTSATRLFEAALDKGYSRAAHYLSEIRTGQI